MQGPASTAGQVRRWRRRRALERIEDELVAHVILRPGRVEIVPRLVVDRDLHFWWIAVVEAVRAAVILVAPEVLRVVDERVMVEPLPILDAVGVAPLAAEGRVLGAGRHGACGAPAGGGAAQREKCSANHRFSPFG